MAIARALVNDPELILADEPTGNLDSRTSVEIMEILQRLNRERQITVVLITHEPDIAEYADARDHGPRRRGEERRAGARAGATPRPSSAPLPPVRGGGLKEESWICARRFRVALLAIRRNKVRSALTMLGVIIGVASVIAMIALGSGARAAIDEQIQSQGTTLIYVSSGSFGGPGRAAQGSGSTQTLTLEDAEAVAREVPTIARWTPVRARPRPGDRGQPELEHLDRGRQRGLPGDPQLGDRRRGRTSPRATCRWPTRSACSARPSRRRSSPTATRSAR